MRSDMEKIEISKTDALEVSDDILESNAVNIHGIARMQILITFIDGLCIQFISGKIVTSFRIFKYFDWMFYALSKSLNRLFIFYFTLLPFFIGMIISLHF